MPLSKEEFPDREFCGRQISFTASDCETLYWLVNESGISETLKERFSNKLRGYFVSAQTQAQSQAMLARRSKTRRVVNQ